MDYILPGNPGEVLTFNFTSFSTEASGSTITDFLEVYDENNTLLYTLGGDLSPFTLVAPLAGECLTFHFTSDAAVRQSGWAALISCVTPCIAPTAAMANTSPINICSVDALSPGNLTASFDASASFTNDAFPVVSYEWDWGDGNRSTTATATTTHTYSNAPNVYVISLKVRTSNTDSDPAGCRSLNSVTKEVRILPPVDFSGTSSTISVNCGQSINLNGLASPQIITQDPPTAISEPIFLPDGTGAVYNTYLNMAGLFPPGATITSGCYPTVTVNLEHSYSGDLKIWLYAPSGEVVLLYNQNGGSRNLVGV